WRRGMKFASLYAACFFVIACSSQEETVFLNGDSTASSMASGSGSGAGGSWTFSGAGGSGGGAEAGCTGELRSVTDGQGNVVQTCPPDQGCFQGQCIAACNAAAGSKGSIGCEFVFPTPPPFQWDLQSCYTAFIANGWEEPVHINVTYAGTTYDVT